MKLTKIKIEDAIQDPDNTRTHSRRNIDAIKKSIEKFGQYRPFVIQKSTNYIAVGNGMHQAMIELGIKTANAFFREMDDQERKALSIADNQTSTLADWDNDLLKKVMGEMPPELQEFTGFSEKQILNMMSDHNEKPGDEDINGLPAGMLQSKPRCKSGKLYQLGSHFLMCGDSSKVNNLKKLLGVCKIDMLFTDPPYGVDYSAKNEMLNSLDGSNRNEDTIKNDDLDIESVSKLWVKVFKNILPYFNEYSCYYICTASQALILSKMMEAMLSNRMEPRHLLIWNKNNHVLGRCDYNYKHEIMIYGWVDKHKFLGGGDQKASVWDFDKPLVSDLHPTMKPVELIVNALKNNTAENMIIADLFGGSGSTLIACEQLSRICYTMEYEPYYCDVIIRRFAEYADVDIEEIYKTEM